MNQAKRSRLIEKVATAINPVTSAEQIQRALAEAHLYDTGTNLGHIFSGSTPSEDVLNGLALLKRDYTNEAASRVLGKSHFGYQSIPRGSDLTSAQLGKAKKLPSPHVADNPAAEARYVGKNRGIWDRIREEAKKRG